MKFEVGVPVASGKAAVVVDGGLAPGVHRFQLVVENARGQRSAPVIVDVVIEPPPLRLPSLTPIPSPLPIPTPFTTPRPR